MAKRRALGRALTGFSQNFLPAWQSMQYMDRLNEREERMRRRDARGDLESMRTQIGTDFTPESDISDMVERFMMTNPEAGFTADDVTKALMSAIPSDPERFKRMTSGLTPEQVGAMPSSEIEARAASAGFPMDQWNTTELGSIAFGGAPPGAAPQATPGRLPDEIVSALDGSLGDVQRDAPNLMGPIQRPKPAIPWLSKIEQTGDPSLADQFGDLQEQHGAWGEEIADLAAQRILDQQGDQLAQQLKITSDFADERMEADIARAVALEEALGNVRGVQALEEYKGRRLFDREDMVKNWTADTQREVARAVQERLSVHEAMTGPERLAYRQRLEDEQYFLAKELQLRADSTIGLERRRFEPDYVSGEAGSQAAIAEARERASQAVVQAQALANLDQNSEYYKRFMANREALNNLDQFTRQGPPEYAIEFDQEGNPVASLALTRTREGGYRYDKQDGFYPLLHPEYMSAQAAGLSLDQMMRMGIGNTPGEAGDPSLDEMAEGMSSVLWEDPTEVPSPSGGWDFTDGRVWARAPWTAAPEAQAGVGLDPRGLTPQQYYGQWAQMIDGEIARTQEALVEKQYRVSSLRDTPGLPISEVNSQTGILNREIAALRDRMTKLATQRSTITQNLSDPTRIKGTPGYE